jgi:hypothetical protein
MKITVFGAMGKILLLVPLGKRIGNFRTGTDELLLMNKASRLFR